MAGFRFWQFIALNMCFTKLQQNITLEDFLSDVYLIRWQHVDDDDVDDDGDDHCHFPHRHQEEEKNKC